MCAHKKKILFLIEAFIVGGAEQVLLNLVNAIDKERFDVTIIAFYKHGTYGGYDCRLDDRLDNRVRFKYIIDNVSQWKYRLFNIVLNRLPKKLLHRLLIGTSYDTEVAFYEGMPTTFLAHSSNISSKKLAWLHYGNGFAELTQTQRKFYQTIYSTYDDIIGVSKGVSKNFLNKIGNHFNVTTLYNIIDDAAIREKSRLFDVKRTSVIHFVTVGRICKVKGYDRLMKVCQSLDSDRYHFHVWMIGDGGIDWLQDLISKYNLKDKISLLGHQLNPMPYVKAADWMVCSSYAEGFSTTITEALIVGTPVISTDCSGTEELLGDSEYGIRCENSEEGLYKAMKQVLDNPSLQMKYAEKAIIKGVSFHKEELLAKIEEVL